VHADLARVIMEFGEENTHLNTNEETCHHEETPSAQKVFAWDVKDVTCDGHWGPGKFFRGGMSRFTGFRHKEIVDPAAIESVRTAKQTGQLFQAYTKDRF